MSPKVKPVRLVASLLATSEEARAEAVARLDSRFGPLIYLSEPLPFTDTDYYTPEMGAPLTRRVAGFVDLVRPEDLARIKRITDSLEKDLAIRGRRRVNIDPGLLSEHSLVLATHKNAPHRLALAKGIYGELTLIFKNGRFNALPWTYPDFVEKRLLEVFFHLRARYLWQLRNRD
jgi:hypothetical protein